MPWRRSVSHNSSTYADQSSYLILEINLIHALVSRGCVDLRIWMGPLCSREQCCAWFLAVVGDSSSGVLISLLGVLRFVQLLHMFIRFMPVVLR